MCKKTVKSETVVHPAGQDWPRNDPFGGLDGYGMEFKTYPDDRISAPPRATLGEKVGLVLGALWNRACGRSRWLSCAVVLAAGVFGLIALSLDGISHLIGGAP